MIGEERLSDLQAEGELRLTDGRSLPFAHDLSAPLSEAELAERLRQKARAMLGERAEALWTLHEQLDRLSARQLGAFLRADQADPLS